MLLYNSRLKLFASKLRSKGMVPFMVSNVYPNNAIALEDPKKKKFMVNRLVDQEKLRMSCFASRILNDDKRSLCHRSHIFACSI